MINSGHSKAIVCRRSEMALPIPIPIAITVLYMAAVQCTAVHSTSTVYIVYTVYCSIQYIYYRYTTIPIGILLYL